jgi:hypothetical protein
MIDMAWALLPLPAGHPGEGRDDGPDPFPSDLKKCSVVSGSSPGKADPTGQAEQVNGVEPAELDQGKAEASRLQASMAAK